MKNKYIICSFLVLLILVMGCSRTQWARFYLLDYVPPITQNDIFKEPFPDQFLRGIFVFFAGIVDFASAIQGQ